MFFKTPVLHTFLDTYVKHALLNLYVYHALNVRLTWVFQNARFTHGAQFAVYRLSWKTYLSGYQLLKIVPYTGLFRMCIFNLVPLSKIKINEIKLPSRKSKCSSILSICECAIFVYNPLKLSWNSVILENRLWNVLSQIVCLMNMKLLYWAVAPFQPPLQGDCVVSWIFPSLLEL